MRRSQRLFAVGLLWVVAGWGGAPAVQKSAAQVEVMGKGYRAVFTPDLAEVKFSVRAAEGEWLPLVASGGVPDMGVFADGVAHLATGGRCGWRMEERDEAIRVVWHAALGLDGQSSLAACFDCTDEGVLMGARLIRAAGTSGGSFWFPPRLAVDPETWDQYALYGPDGGRHSGSLAELSPCPAYAGVTKWGKNGTVVQALASDFPMLALRGGKPHAGFALVYVDYPNAWRDSSLFIQRHTPSNVYLYGISSAADERWRWAWLAPLTEGASEKATVAHLLASARPLLAEGVGELPPLPPGIAALPDFPAALRRPQPLDDIRQAVVHTMNETTDRDYALSLIRKTGPDLVVRGWFKWNARPPVEKWHRYAEETRGMGALFGGGITCSALYDGENGLTREQWLDMATRGRDGNLVDAWGKPGIRHGSLSNSAYIDYLFRWCREQIDAGVDYLFMDEHTAALSRTEGYDDYSLRDFRRYLTEICPHTKDWLPRDPRWQAELGIDLANPQVCPDGQIGSLDCRYLLLHPPAKPAADRLATLWGEFRKWRDDRAWKALTDRIRAYAKTRGRRVLISANGLAPYVDLQVLGVWGNWTLDDGHISLPDNRIQTWRSYVTRGRDLAGGEVPVVLFHDWGMGETPFPFMAVPPGEREVWMRTRGAEIYAAGAFFAFPVLGPFGCDAGRDGTLETIARQTVFYQTHRELYNGSQWAGCEGLTASHEPTSLAAWWHPGSSSLVVHVVNRDVRGGVLQPVSAPVELAAPVEGTPDRAVVISPDFAGEKPVAVRTAGDGLAVALPGLDAYSVVLLHYPQKPSLARLADPVRLRPARQWARPSVAEFRVRRDGSVANGDELNGFLQGMLHTHLRNPPVFSFTATSPGELRLRVQAVATVGARLAVRIDDAPAKLIDLPDRDGKNDGGAAEYAQTFSFPFSAGAHRIAIDNTGEDWLTIEWIEFVGAFAD